VLASAVLGALVNFPWEWAHSVLYRGVPSFTWRDHLVCCGLAALADGVGIGVIFGIGAIAFRDPHWTGRPSPARLGLVALLSYFYRSLCYSGYYRAGGDGERKLNPRRAPSRSLCLPTRSGAGR
jgi:hypothetical protein